MKRENKIESTVNDLDTKVFTKMNLRGYNNKRIKERDE